MDSRMTSNKVPGRRRVSICLDEMLARAADGVFTMTADGRIVLWNRAAERILGYSGRDVVGRRCCDFLHAWNERGRRLGCRGCALTALVRKGAAIPSFDVQVRHKVGGRIRINVSTLVVPDRRRTGAPWTIHVFHSATPRRESPSHATTPNPGAAPPASMPRPLTPREAEIVQLLTTGASSRAVAEHLSVRTATVRNHVQHILAKLGAHSRLEIVAFALRHRLL